MSAAWHLHKYGFEVTVFEKNDRIGGNAYTIDVTIGGEQRWVDMGVNDFNANTYQHLVKCFNELGVQYRRLEDTTCYGTLDGSIIYTIDSEGNTPAPEAITRDITRFQKEAPEVLTDPQYRYALVKEYVKEKGYSDEFVRYYLYPRISGMYFSDWHGAGNMPMWSVMKYYSLQEGLNSDGPARPERMYFVNGSREWTTKLYDAAKRKFRIVLNAEASLHAGPEGIDVHTSDRVERFDVAVLALQAYEARRCFKAGLIAEVSKFLDSFDYHDDHIAVHTYHGVLPPYVNAWRTYNILIRRNAGSSLPYSITYMVNRHQNDSQNPRYNGFRTPNFFVTVNPPVPIPETHVLRRTDGPPAYAMFRDIAYNLNAVKAQERLKDLQGINNVYFTGGYTDGAGLHEECWVNGMELATQINDRHRDDDQAKERIRQGMRYPLSDIRKAVDAGYVR